MQRKMKRMGRRHGFTLVQLVMALGAVSMLGTLTFSAFSDGRSSARRAQCDARLKTIALALDAHRQEYTSFPATLVELHTKHYLHDAEELHCPSDPRLDGTYGDFYIIRAPRDDADLPTVVCPFHEDAGSFGTQAFKGNYTKQFMTKPARLEMASGATVERPGQPPVAGVAGMTLRGGDRVRTAAGGAAIIRFADNSASEMQGNADVMVMQSFVSSRASGTLHTLVSEVRQTLGTVIHRVNRGSKFDVATPTATAGALGTAYRININPGGSGTLTVLESRVYLSTLKGRIIVETGQTVPLTGGALATPGLSPNPVATPTPTPKPTPTPIPTATPTPTPTPCNKGTGAGSGSGACD